MNLFLDVVTVDPSDAISQVTKTAEDVLPFLLCLVSCVVLFKSVQKFMGVGPWAMVEPEDADLDAEGYHTDSCSCEHCTFHREANEGFHPDDVPDHWYRMTDDEERELIADVNSYERVMDGGGCDSGLRGGITDGCDCAWCEHNRENQS